MLATLGFLIGESGFTPLFQGKIESIAINQFWQVPGRAGRSSSSSSPCRRRSVLFVAGWSRRCRRTTSSSAPGYTPGDLDFDPLGLKPEDPEALKEMQTKESRAASKIRDPVVCVCRVDGVDHTLFCLLWLFVCRVSRRWRGHMLFVCCRCVSRVSRLDERIRPATHPGGFAQAPARPPRLMLAAAGMIVQELQTGATLF